MPTDLQFQDANEPGIFLGCLLLAIAVVPQAEWVVRGYDQVHDLETAGWAFYMSGLLWASYKFESKTFLFRGILAVFRTIHAPRGAWNALVYSTAFALLGVWQVWRAISNDI